MGLLVIVCSIGTGLLRAVVITKLWDWFVVPRFDLPTFGVWLTYGLLILAGVIWEGITPASAPSDTRTYREQTVAALSAVLARAVGLGLVLLVAWFASAQVPA